MPELTPQTEEIKKTIALQVFYHLMQNPTATKKDVCEEIGISVDFYDRWIKRSGDVIIALRAYVHEEQQALLTEIQATRFHAIRHMLALLNSGNLGVDATLKLMNYLDQYADQLETSHNAKPGTEDRAASFLKQGPHTKRKQSRLISIDISGDDVTVSDNEIIDLPVD